MRFVQPLRGATYLCRRCMSLPGLGVISSSCRDTSSLARVSCWTSSFVCGLVEVASATPPAALVRRRLPRRLCSAVVGPCCSLSNVSWNSLRMTLSCCHPSWATLDNDLVRNDSCSPAQAQRPARATAPAPTLVPTHLELLLARRNMGGGPWWLAWLSPVLEWHGQTLLQHHASTCSSPCRLP